MSTDAVDENSDGALLMRWASGDVHAGGVLARRFAGSLQRFYSTKVAADDVEELAQQVWLSLADNVRRKNLNSSPVSVRAYVLGIARHVLFRYLRRKYRSITIDPINSSIAVLEPSLSQAVGSKLQAERLRLALQTMPVDTQVLLELRYVHEMTTAEIAGVYDIAEGTVKSRLARARALLDSTLKAVGGRHAR